MIDQNRDGIIDKEDLRDTFAAMGEFPTSINVKSYGVGGESGGFRPLSTQMKSE